MFACSGQDPARLKGRRSEITSSMKRLFGDPEFRSSIDAATNTPSLFKTRIIKVKELIDEVLTQT